MILRIIIIIIIIIIIYLFIYFLFFAMQNNAKIKQLTFGVNSDVFNNNIHNKRQ